MADIDVALRWEGTGLEFTASGRAGKSMRIDGDTKSAASPVETLLIALASCMAADILDIGGRMRLPIRALDVEASGMRNPEPPRRFLSVRLVFRVAGVSDADAPKLERALALSEEKYCSVIHTMRQDLEVVLELDRVTESEGTGGGD